jgi:hypothetical protein
MWPFEIAAYVSEPPAARHAINNKDKLLQSPFPILMVSVSDCHALGSKT